VNSASNRARRSKILNTSGQISAAATTVAASASSTPSFSVPSAVRKKPPHALGETGIVLSEQFIKRMTDSNGGLRVPVDIFGKLPPTAQGRVREWMQEGGFAPLLSEISDSESMRQLLAANLLSEAVPHMMITDPIAASLPASPLPASTYSRPTLQPRLHIERIKRLMLENRVDETFLQQVMLLPPEQHAQLEQWHCDLNTPSFDNTFIHLIYRILPQPLPEDALAYTQNVAAL